MLDHDHMTLSSLENAGLGGGISMRRYKDLLSECKSSLHKTLVVLSCDNETGDNWKHGGTFSPRFCFWFVLCFNHQACFTAWKERRLFPLLRIPPRTGLGTRQSLHHPRARQMLGPILKEWPLEEGVQLIPICPGVCGLQYRLSVS